MHSYSSIGDNSGNSYRQQHQHNHSSRSGVAGSLLLLLLLSSAPLMYLTYKAVGETVLEFNHPPPQDTNTGAAIKLCLHFFQGQFDRQPLYLALQSRDNASLVPARESRKFFRMAVAGLRNNSHFAPYLTQLKDYYSIPEPEGAPLVTGGPNRSLAILKVDTNWTSAEKQTKLQQWLEHYALTYPSEYLGLDVGSAQYDAWHRRYRAFATGNSAMTNALKEETYERMMVYFGITMIGCFVFVTVAMHIRQRLSLETLRRLFSTLTECDETPRGSPRANMMAAGGGGGSEGGRSSSSFLLELNRENKSSLHAASLLTNYSVNTSAFWLHGIYVPTWHTLLFLVPVVIVPLSFGLAAAMIPLSSAIELSSFAPVMIILVLVPTLFFNASRYFINATFSFQSECSIEEDGNYFSRARNGGGVHGGAHHRKGAGLDHNHNGTSNNPGGALNNNNDNGRDPRDPRDCVLITKVRSGMALSPTRRYCPLYRRVAVDAWHSVVSPMVQTCLFTFFVFGANALVPQEVVSSSGLATCLALFVALTTQLLLMPISVAGMFPALFSQSRIIPVFADACSEASSLEGDGFLVHLCRGLVDRIRMSAYNEEVELQQQYNHTQRNSNSRHEQVNENRPLIPSSSVRKAKTPPPAAGANSNFSPRGSTTSSSGSAKANRHRQRQPSTRRTPSELTTFLAGITLAAAICASAVAMNLARGDVSFYPLVPRDAPKVVQYREMQHSIGGPNLAPYHVVFEPRVTGGVLNDTFLGTIDSIVSGTIQQGLGITSFTSVRGSSSSSNNGEGEEEKDQQMKGFSISSVTLGALHVDSVFEVEALRKDPAYNYLWESYVDPTSTLMQIAVYPPFDPLTDTSAAEDWDNALHILTRAMLQNYTSTFHFVGWYGAHTGIWATRNVVIPRYIRLIGLALAVSIPLVMLLNLFFTHLQRMRAEAAMWNYRAVLTAVVPLLLPVLTSASSLAITVAVFQFGGGFSERFPVRGVSWFVWPLTFPVVCSISALFHLAAWDSYRNIMMEKTLLRALDQQNSRRAKAAGKAAAANANGDYLRVENVREIVRLCTDPCTDHSQGGGGALPRPVPASPSDRSSALGKSPTPPHLSRGTPGTPQSPTCTRGSPPAAGSILKKESRLTTDQQQLSRPTTPGTPAVGNSPPDAAPAATAVLSAVVPAGEAPSANVSVPSSNSLGAPQPHQQNISLLSDVSPTNGNCNGQRQGGGGGTFDTDEQDNYDMLGGGGNPNPNPNPSNSLIPLSLPLRFGGVSWETYSIGLLLCIGYIPIMCSDASLLNEIGTTLLAAVIVDVVLGFTVWLPVMVRLCSSVLGYHSEAEDSDDDNIREA